MVQSDAVTICAEAFRQSQVIPDLTSFSLTQVFPFNNALGFIRDVVRDMNRRGDYWSMETSSLLAFSAGTFQYTMSAETPAIDPKKITQVRLELSDEQGQLDAFEYHSFRDAFRKSAILTTKPTAWTKYGDTLELNTKPDKDYTITVYHIQKIPLPSTTASTFGAWPEDDEDVLISGVKYRLLKAIGSPEWDETFQLYEERLKELLGDMKQDHALPNVMPSLF